MGRKYNQSCHHVRFSKYISLIRETCRLYQLSTEINQSNVFYKQLPKTITTLRDYNRDVFSPPSAAWHSSRVYTCFHKYKWSMKRTNDQFSIRTWPDRCSTKVCPTRINRSLFGKNSVPLGPLRQSYVSRMNVFCRSTFSESLRRPMFISSRKSQTPSHVPSNYRGARCRNIAIKICDPIPIKHHHKTLSSYVIMRRKNRTHN